MKKGYLSRVAEELSSVSMVRINTSWVPFFVATFLAGCAAAPPTPPPAAVVPAQPPTCEEARQQLVNAAVMRKVAHGEDGISAMLEARKAMDEYNSRYPCPGG